jgi:hypothetical protein
MLRQFRKGQSTAEYAIVIGLVIAAVAAMQIYVKRGIQGKMRDASDLQVPTTGESYGVNSFKQYEPRETTAVGMHSKRDSNVTETTSIGGGVNRSIDGDEINERTGQQNVSAVQ